MVSEAKSDTFLENEGCGVGDIVVVECGEGFAQEFMGCSVPKPNHHAMERRIEAVQERKTALDATECARLTNMYGGYNVQHLGGTKEVA